MKKSLIALGIMCAAALAFTGAPEPAQAQLQRINMCKVKITRPPAAVAAAKRACLKQRAELAARKKKKT